MPSMLHEALLLLFRNRPTLAPELLRDTLHVEVPDFTEVRFESAELTDLVPAEYRADLVILLVDGVPVLAIVVEVQLSRDTRKHYTWPVYLSGLRARFECAAVLLVVAPDVCVAAFCAEPIDMGHPGWVLRPIVLGPELVPVVTDRDAAARSPELAVLSALAHGRTAHGIDIVVATLAAVAGLDPDRARLYADLAVTALDGAARTALEAIMNSGDYEYQWSYTRQCVAKGKAETLLEVLEARGIDIPDEVRARVLECTDWATLSAWARKAVTVHAANELFDVPEKHAS